MLNVIESFDSFQRGLVSPYGFKSNVLTKAILSFKSDHKILESRKDFLYKKLWNVNYLDLAQNRMLAAYSENRALIFNMEPPSSHFQAEDGYKKMVIKWRRPKEREITFCKNDYLVCCKFRKHDCGLFTISGESGSLGVIDSETLGFVCDMGTLSCPIYEHTFSPNQELLIGAVRLPNNLCVMDLRIGRVSLTMTYFSGSMNAISWNPKEEEKIATANSFGHVVLWDLRYPKSFMKSKEYPIPETSHIPVLSFDTYGNRLIYFNPKGYLRSLDVDSLRQIYSFKCKNLTKSIRRYQIDFVGLTNPEVMFIPNGKELSIHSVLCGRKLGKLESYLFDGADKVLYNNLRNEVYSAGLRKFSLHIWRKASCDELL